MLFDLGPVLEELKREMRVASVTLAAAALRSASGIHVSDPIATAIGMENSIRAKMEEEWQRQAKKQSKS